MMHVYRILYARPDGSLTSVVTSSYMAEAGAALLQELAEGHALGYTVVELHFDAYTPE